MKMQKVMNKVIRKEQDLIHECTRKVHQKILLYKMKRVDQFAWEIGQLPPITGDQI